MTMSQVDSGKALEYGIAQAMIALLPATANDHSPMQIARDCYERCEDNEQRRINRASSTISRFLIENDVNLRASEFTVSIQPDREGVNGDVRDILISNLTNGTTIGISSKNRHNAVKHSRVSQSIDFGHDWCGINCSATYFNDIRPIFNELSVLRENGFKWRDVTNKHARFYAPILSAFQSELHRLLDRDHEQVASGIMHYLLGRQDFYKIVKTNGDIEVKSFNIYGSLGWGRRIPIPRCIVQISLKPRSTTTLSVIFDAGWNISMRLHSASTLVEPSLKWDVSLVGSPSNMQTNSMHY